MPDVPAQPVSVAFDVNQTRAAIRLFHPKGNSITLETADAAEGIAAFVEKRPPRWLDR